MKKLTLLSLIILTLIAAIIIACKKNTMLNENNNDIQKEKTYRRADINSQRFEQNLKTLASGMLDFSDQKVVNEIVYKEAIKGLDRYFFITLDKLFEEGRKKGVDLRKELNENINRNNCFPFNKDNLTTILKDNIINDREFQYHIVVPNLDKYSESIKQKTPLITYSFLEEGPPIPQVVRDRKGCPVIEIPFSGLPKPDPWWVVGLPVFLLPPCPSAPGMWNYDCKDRWIRNCAASGPQCEVCPATSAGSNTIGRTGKYVARADEIIIYLKEPKNVQENCYSNIIPLGNTTVSCTGPGWYAGCPNYATISSVSGFDYYTRISGSGTMSIQKVTYPIIDTKYQNIDDPAIIIANGNILTLCANLNSFKSYDEAVGGTSGGKGFAFGGIYKIQRLNQLPLYFAYPSYLQEFWFNDGPDIIPLYTVNETGVCSNGKAKIEESYNVDYCRFCDDNVFSLPLNYFYDNKLTNTMLNYWMDNVITIGIGNDNTLIKPGNFTDFNASNSKVICIPPGSSPICQLFKTNSTTYEVKKPFLGNQTYMAGDNIRVHVTATFSNGEKIDECKDIILSSAVSTYQHVFAHIRGKIVNYQVDFYKL